MLTRAGTPAMIPGVLHELLPICEDALGLSFRFLALTFSFGCNVGIECTLGQHIGFGVGVHIECTLGQHIGFGVGVHIECTLLTRPNETTMNLFVASAVWHETSNMHM